VPRTDRLIPPGRWGIAVSGGADSVALLRFVASRRDDLVILHVDHGTRAGGSGRDARFVRELADGLDLPCRVRRLGGGAGGEARWRRERLAFFKGRCDEDGLTGVMLGHHADDVAETLAIRLLRGSPRSGTMGLAPLRREAIVSGVPLLRPLLRTRRRTLRRYLRRLGQAWREDATNSQPVTLRNRVRAALSRDENQATALLELAVRTARVERRLCELASTWPAEMADGDVAAARAVPWVLQRRSARAWLLAAGVPEARATPSAVDRMLALLDALGPRAASFAGGVRVRRHRGRVVSQGGGASPAEPG
jgi:tRNA(Ile)-lysidine synthase